MQLGYTMMTEQAGPKDLVAHVVGAQEVGFDVAVSSDHFFPWLDEMGHSPHAWTVLGAAAQATSRIPLMTYVTCPTLRYNPAVVAQKAATLQILSDGRFTPGLGSGENLNEHVVGEGWPPVDQRQDMLEEAVQIIRELFTGDLVTWEGSYFRVDSARLWDVPEGGVPIGMAVSGEKSMERLAPHGDHLIAIEPDGAVVEQWRQIKGGDTGSRVVGQVPVCWDPDRDAAIARAHDQFRWSLTGFAVNADLPTPAGFSAVGELVRPEDIAEAIPCGPDLDELAESVRPFLDAGFTDLAIVQVGDEKQDEFLEQAAGPLLEKLQAL